MAKNSNSLEIPVGHMVNLNMSARGCGGSSNSLPGTPAGEHGPANSVMSWAVSFEKLLEDPFGVRYFTDFLKSEVSAENILFWQACEKFKKIPATSLDELKAEARSIYSTYLSESAPYSVNIDDTAKTEEKDLQQPTPDMFNKAQAQIFKLMKMDSYRRFVRSPLYQSCTLATVEGKGLPRLSNESPRMGSWEDVASRVPLREKKKSDPNSFLGGKSASEKQRQKRGSWGGNVCQMTHLMLLCYLMYNGRSSPCSPELGGGGGSRVGLEGGYCCVYLPDGSASLAPTPNGQPIKDLLTSLCEKRGFPLKDVIIYLHGKDKQPLSLDQDCSVLRNQQVSLELRVTFAVEIAFTGKTVGIMVKSSKTLQEALSVVLQKHNIKPQEALVTMVSINNISQGGAASTGPEARSLSQDRAKAQPRSTKNREMDGFLDMLTRAQNSRVDDQRGLLTKEQLEVPSFLQLPTEQVQEPEDPSIASSSTTDSKAKSEDKNSAENSAEAAKEAPDSAKLKSPDMRETTV
uniref:Regulator of G protein signaling 14a n=1 Tax=Neolamprologus brichardi TaxID=32507 RepID=A0A3Q4GWU3_NEOBR